MSHDLIIIRDDDGIAYAVPRIEMERFRMTPQRQASIAAQLLAQAAASDGALLPLDETPVYEVDPSELAPFRLSRRAWTRLESALYGGSSDVRGFEAGELRPSWVAVAPPLNATPPTRVHTYPSWYVFAREGGASPDEAHPEAR